MKSFFRILKYIQIPRGKLVLYLFYTMVATLFSLMSINLLSPFMDLVFKQGDAAMEINSKAIGPLKGFFQNIISGYGKLFALGVVCAVIVLATVLKNFFNYLSLSVSTPVKSKTLMNFRTLLYKKILGLPISFFTDQRKGDLMSRVGVDVGEVQVSVFAALEGFIKDPLTIISFLVSMVYISPQLSLFLLIFLPVTALVIGRISKHLKRQSTLIANINGENLSHIEETLGGIKVVKAFTAEKKMLKKFEESNMQLYHLANKLTMRRELASPLTEVLGVTVLCLILYIGGRLVFSSGNQLTSGDLMSFIISFAMIINPAKNLSGTIASIQKGLGAIDRIEQILHAPVVVEEKPNAAVLKGFSSSIEFRNVTFCYDDKVILKDINLKVEKGKTVALVGSSGAGKSTLADLLPRFHDPADGQILIDGVDIREFTIESLRQQMSIVTQEPILFNDSIANNIALGSNATQSEIEAAAKIANAHHFISNKENGYNTGIGDRGMKLSGGERQRMTIARAVLRNPPILILDEATSSLDTESERLVQDALNNLMKDRTSLVIAHRLSTIRNADEIVVMQKGEIIERGTHESLVAQNGFYKKLVDMQEIK